MRFISAVAASISISGCVLNAVTTVPNQRAAAPSDGDALLLIGLGLEAPTPSPVYAITLDRYDPIRRKQDANCFRYDHATATTPGTPESTRYFLFRVPAGHYVFSGFSSYRLNGKSKYAFFAAPEGKVIYVGDFIYIGDKRVEVRRDLKAAKSALVRQWSIAGEFVVADLMPTGSPGIFICTP